MTHSHKVLLVQGSLALILLTGIGVTDAQTAPTEAWLPCKPKQIIETLGRQLHVQCSNSIVLRDEAGMSRTISFIAILASDDAATRFLSMASNAMLSNRPFVAYLSGNSDRNVAGCNAADCRTPIYFGISNDAADIAP
jgi:hypothetical protein